MAITHSKVSSIPDGGDASLIRPTDWNASHVGTIPAASVTVSDAAGDFTASDVEGVLAEIQADNEAHIAASDPHGIYVREADSNWLDLTDGGTSTLHSHPGGGGGSTLTVREEDNSPIDTAVTTIRFPNGTLVDYGAGDVGYVPAGGGGTLYPPAPTIFVVASLGNGAHLDTIAATPAGYRCDGTTDNVDITAAIAALPV